MKYRTTRAFTLIEMVIVLAILAVVMAIVAVPLIRWRDRVNAENFMQSFSSQMNLARTLTLSTGTVYRVNLVDASNFQTEKLTGASTWSVVGNRFSNSAVRLTTTGARLYKFDSRGILTAYDSGGNQTTNTNLTASFYGYTRTIIVTALGLTRAV